MQDLTTVVPAVSVKYEDQFFSVLRHYSRIPVLRRDSQLKLQGYQDVAYYVQVLVEHHTETKPPAIVQH